MVEAAEPTLTQDSTRDNPIPPSQPDLKKRQKTTSVILSDEEEIRVVEWLADHPLMYKKIKEYKETDRREKLWDELGEDLGYTGSQVITKWFTIYYYYLFQGNCIVECLRILGQFLYEWCLCMLSQYLLNCTEV